jgi:hypothetical protein
MYQPYPDDVQPGSQFGHSATPIPPSVARAVQVMYVGAVASLIGISIDLATAGSLRARLVTINKNGAKLTPTQVTDTEHLAIGALIVTGLIGAALWYWMAQNNRAGKSWARIVATVLFGIDTIGVIADIDGTSALAGTVATRIFGIVVWLVGLAAIILLWQRTSSDYFHGAPRY